LNEDKVRLVDNSPEKVALDLLRSIAMVEKRALHSGAPEGWTSATRSWLLRTYAECMLAVREGRVDSDS
jgi:hypothetical protein